MKIKFFILSIILVLLSTDGFAQKRSAATATRDFYRFHFSRQNMFDQREVSLRNRFFTPKLRRLFDAELKRQRIQSKKYPTDKPYFEGLPFQPIEFCPKDYRVGTARTKGQFATVNVNFVNGKSSCDANDGTPLLYKMQLSKISGKWLIDDVIYDDGGTLTKAFNEAKNIK